MWSQMQLTQQNRFKIINLWESLKEKVLNFYRLTSFYQEKSEKKIYLLFQSGVELHYLTLLTFQFKA